jgi:hypothetical protein
LIPGKRERQARQIFPVGSRLVEAVQIVQLSRRDRRRMPSTLDPNQRSRADGPDFFQNRMRYW